MKKEEIQMESNRTAEWKARRGKILSCSFCPPNKMENQKRKSKYLSKSWKDKTKKIKQFEIN